MSRTVSCGCTVVFIVQWERFGGCKNNVSTQTHTHKKKTANRTFAALVTQAADMSSFIKKSKKFIILG